MTPRRTSTPTGYAVVHAATQSVSLFPDDEHTDITSHGRAFTVRQVYLVFTDLGDGWRLLSATLSDGVNVSRGYIDPTPPPAWVEKEVLPSVVGLLAEGHSLSDDLARTVTTRSGGDPYGTATFDELDGAVL